MGLKPFLIGILDKFLIRYGYVLPETNMDFYLKQKTSQAVRFALDVLISGLIIHGALFFVYFFKKVSLPLYTHPALVVSYGLASYVILNWTSKIKGR